MNNEFNYKGWIALHRSISDHWLWKDKPFTRGQAWVDIMLECNHSENKVRIGNEIICCNRGESIKSLKTWANRWGWNISKVRRFLKLLKNDSMIELKPAHNTTHLKVLNYDIYQNERNESETKVKTFRNKPETKVATNNNDNNDNNEEQKALLLINKYWNKKEERPSLTVISAFVIKYGYTEVEYAFKEANKYNAYSVGYLLTILNNRYMETAAHKAQGEGEIYKKDTAIIAGSLESNLDDKEAGPASIKKIIFGNKQGEKTKDESTKNLPGKSLNMSDELKPKEIPSPDYESLAYIRSKQEYEDAVKSGK